MASITNVLLHNHLLDASNENDDDDDEEAEKMMFVEQQKVSFSVPRRWCRDHHHFLRTHLGLSLLLFSSSAFRCWNTTKLLFCIARLIVRVPFSLLFFVDAEKQANKKKHIFTIINDDDDDARLFLDLFSRLFSVRTFHANYRSAQLCETTAKISSSP
jgi:hypothetical protein|tara:strand:- start:918 stop:1391 length:474 start_codon:yes stop_codon:yes gene_type:complete